MEPNFGLVEELVSCKALTGDEREEVRAAKTRSKRCRKLLKFVLGKSDDIACCQLLVALDKTDQRHVVNFVLQDAGTSKSHDTISLSISLLLARLMGQYCFARCLLSVGVVCRR